ncbi:hypothetical protein KDN34_00240 [Shewanella yunxiaonensis]|uniref:Heavy metal binding domain-containing protein n=1 Tax=Shewanella yunxiaonensis TaxID=2829809 RepID=A0ABX7YTH2_9GAMM|nr:MULTISPECIES: heavy metal-binding domain-containing protein [Shewanella]MDF0534668.1 heavy metal-binding domain-containing protein [Shewanella sp. A32]QUN05962.1 hypothetical protein KDN34_00240 [Shewanella yunxiaonensis]
MKILFTLFFALMLSLGLTSYSYAGEAVQQTKAADTAEVYHCPMHPEVTGHKGDSCPKCGMKLVKAKADAVVYHCPMHPEVTGHKGDSCPKCGMKLVPAQSQGDSAMHAMHMQQQ